MDISPYGLLVNWFPRLPHIVKTAILAAAGKSTNTEHQPWLAEVVVASARPILQTPAPLLRSQKSLNIDPGVWGRQWMAQYTVPSPQDLPSTMSNVLTLEQAVRLAVEVLSMCDDEKCCPIAHFAPSGVEAEWTFYRENANAWSRLPKGFSQGQLYQTALSEFELGEDSPVILYAHGGAFCLMDPSNHRFMTSQLAHDTNARVLSVRYRLSPQAIFPAALMDLFLCYLALLYPPPGSFHKPVPASRIVLAGDSSGGNLVTALQVLLLTLVNHGGGEIVNPWNTTCKIKISNPPTAALSLSSPWLDITRSLPSQRLNERWDFIAPASALTSDLVSTSPLFPADEIWPSKPERAETYCEAFMCAHPLVSPLLAPDEILREFPSTYICCGWEGMTDESEVFVRRIWQAKNDVQISASSQNGIGSCVSEKHQPDSGYASSTDRSPCQAPADSHRQRDTTASQPLLLHGPKSSALPQQWQLHQEMADTLSHSMNQKSSSVPPEIVFDGYTALPHTFPLIPFLAATKVAKHNRTQHIKRAIDRLSTTHHSPKWHDPATIARGSKATWTFSKPTLATKTVDFCSLGMAIGIDCLSGYTRVEPLTDSLIQHLVQEGRDFRVELELKLRKQESARVRTEQDSHRSHTQATLVGSIMQQLRAVVFAS